MKEQESTRIQAGSPVTALQLDLELDKLLDELSLKIREKQRLRGWNNDVLIKNIAPHASHQTVVNALMGRGNPTIKTILSIAKALGYGVRIEFTRP